MKSGPHLKVAIPLQTKENGNEVLAFPQMVALVGREARYRGPTFSGALLFPLPRSRNEGAMTEPKADDAVERVAEAIAPWFSGADIAYGEHIEAAKAAIAAMRRASQSNQE